MLSRSGLARRPVLLALPALYVAVAAVRSGDVSFGLWVSTATAVGIAIVGGTSRGTSRGSSLGSARGPTSESTDVVVRARRVTACALSIAVATAALSTREGWAVIAREIAALVAGIAGIGALGRIDGDVGLARSASEASAPKDFGLRTTARVATFANVLVWGIAVLLDGAAWLGKSAFAEDTAAPYAAAAGVLSLAVTGGTALLFAGLRRLELTATPRALACAGIAALALVIGVILALGGYAYTDAASAIAASLASFVILRAVQVHDVLTLARRGRRLTALAVFGVPVAALVAIAVETRSRGVSGIAFVLALVAVLVGAVSPKLEEPFLPARGVLLDALRDAREGARDRDARAAMSHALVRLREAAAIGLGPTAAPSPELWLLRPTRVVTVDAAGYLAERNAELPFEIFDVAIGEPHATLRTEVLRALEVRRADLRPLLAWLEQRDGLFATVIADGDDPEGLLVMPAGARTEALTLEEVRDAKRLADSFVAVCQAESAFKRHLLREHGLMKKVDEQDDMIDRLHHELAKGASRNALASARLSRPATVGIYSAASRMAYEALERRVAQDAPIVLVARAGIDPVPYVARAHLSGPRKDRPLVVVDGTSTREHDLARWRDAASSPIALADGGLLFLVDGAALPREIQSLVARVLTERRPPWAHANPLDVILALSSTSRIDELADEGRLVPELCARLEGADAIELPRLRDRPEDLRSIVADRLAREGLRTRGTPIGIEAAAFARLVEHPFEGEDAELTAVVSRLVQRVVGDVVRGADVAALGIPSFTAPTSELDLDVAIDLSNVTRIDKRRADEG